MRLGQLSRLVNSKPTDILLYLKKEFDVELGTHLNTKVDDALAEKVIEAFKVEEAPEGEEPQVDAGETTAAPEPDIVEEIDSEKSEEESVDEPVEFERNQEVDAETIANAPFIQTEKIELSGPKVVGKIDLPPPLSEQMIEVDGVMMSKQELADQKRERRKERSKKHDKRSRRRSSKSVGDNRKKTEEQLEQMKKEREQSELSKKLENREKRIREKQKEESKPKSTYVPKKPKRKKTNSPEVKEEKKKASEYENLSTLGKIWKWFNT